MDLSLVVVAAIVGYVVWSKLSSRRVAAQAGEVKAALDAGAALVDVRSPAEFSGGHLPGAKNVPVQGIGAQASKLGDTVVVYCASGMRSARAARVLRQAGVTKVYDLGAMANGQALLG